MRSRSSEPAGVGTVEKLAGRVAIVTGGSQGIGRAVAERLAEDGATVAVIALHEETVAEVVRDLRAGGAAALGVVADVSDEADTARYVAATVRAFGRVDILVNNAGTIAIGPVVETSTATWDHVLSVNARGVFLGCREVARQLIDQGGGGRIVNVASGAGLQGGASIAAYAASKFAVVGFTQSLAAELAPHGISVNACCPGHVTTTRMWDQIDADFARTSGAAPGETKESVVKDVPFGRSGRPEEIASVVSFLASDDASFMTGESVVVDGGLLRH
jgi:meso-butanediol dehydrogenase/(S,S)-butanediol dehydrogenase/diacetyl reductase